MRETLQRRMFFPAPEEAHHQQISRLWLRATRIRSKCRPCQGRIPISPFLLAVPDFFTCRNVWRNQTIHGVPAELRRPRVGVKDEKRVARAGGDQGNGCDADNAGGKNFGQPEANENYGGHAGEQVPYRKMNIVRGGKRNQNPEDQEETELIAPLPCFEKQADQRKADKNRREQEKWLNPTQQERVDEDPHHENDENETQASGPKTVRQPAGGQGQRKREVQQVGNKITDYIPRPHYKRRGVDGQVVLADSEDNCQQ